MLLMHQLSTRMNKHILIVEDNNDLISLYCDLLEPEGYRISTLPGSENIVRQLAQLQPDLVLLDFLIAGINGGELCSQIKKNIATSRIPVIMVSAFPRMINSLGHYGWDDFIAKPFETSDFRDVIRKHTLEMV